MEFEWVFRCITVKVNIIREKKFKGLFKINIYFKMKSWAVKQRRWNVQNIDLTMCKCMKNMCKVGICCLAARLDNFSSKYHLNNPSY